MEPKRFEFELSLLSTEQVSTCITGAAVPDVDVVVGMN
jgi:hypothetical protein